MASQDWVKAGFLPLLDSAPAVASTPIPRWTNSICSLEEQPKRARQEWSAEAAWGVAKRDHPVETCGNNMRKLNVLGLSDLTCNSQ